MTITEALAEMKTIVKRIDKKKKFILDNVARQDLLKDSLANDGGSEKVINNERQAINDLMQRMVDIRIAIQRCNLATSVSIAGRDMSIAEWLVWRREVSPVQKGFLDRLSASVKNVREQAHSKGVSIRSGDGEGKPTDVIVHVNEVKLAKDLEQMETVLGDLDGQLSLKNATVAIELN